LGGRENRGIKNDRVPTGGQIRRDHGLAQAAVGVTYTIARIRGLGNGKGSAPCGSGEDDEDNEKEKQRGSKRPFGHGVREQGRAESVLFHIDLRYSCGLKTRKICWNIISKDYPFQSFFRAKCLFSLNLIKFNISPQT
jgi:hypothetical protein